MGYEIDFLAVGEKKSGDAICIRWGNLYGTREEQKVVVVDAGYQSTGQDIVNHIEKYYKTKVIDLLISTHPDGDHVGGLCELLDNAEVKEFWIHQPWEHNENLSQEFADGRITDASIAERMKNNLQKAYDAVKKAKRKGIPLDEPFQGKTWDNSKLIVVGPKLSFYESLIPGFARMPERVAACESYDSYSGFQKYAEKEKELIEYYAQWNTDEGIDDKDTTSDQNNSSVILKLEIDNKTIILTGDAGIRGLEQASEYIEKGSMSFIQIPHHGSRRNVGPEILNKLVGDIVPEGQKRDIVGFISCASGSDKHPHQSVINAFIRRGVKVVTTEGSSKSYRHNAPDREDWTTAPIRDYLTNYNIEE